MIAIGASAGAGRLAAVDPDCDQHVLLPGSEGSGRRRSGQTDAFFIGRSTGCRVVDARAQRTFSDVWTPERPGAGKAERPAPTAGWRLEAPPLRQRDPEVAHHLQLGIEADERVDPRRSPDRSDERASARVRVACEALRRASGPAAAIVPCQTEVHDVRCARRIVGGHAVAPRRGLRGAAGADDRGQGRKVIDREEAVTVEVGTLVIIEADGRSTAIAEPQRLVFEPNPVDPVLVERRHAHDAELHGWIRPDLGADHAATVLGPFGRVAIPDAPHHHEARRPRAVRQRAHGAGAALLEGDTGIGLLRADRDLRAPSKIDHDLGARDGRVQGIPDDNLEEPGGIRCVSGFPYQRDDRRQRRVGRARLSL